MAQKEESHRETVDGLNAELLTVKRQHEELKAISSNQVRGHTMDVSGILMTRFPGFDDVRRDGEHGQAA